MILARRVRRGCWGEGESIMENSNTKKFIIDREINLNEYDFLKTKVYSDSLTTIIKNIEINKVFTIGIFGNWGTGKSSIIKTSEKDFDEKKVKFITYDAWRYVNDSFRRMFLRKLREDLKYEETNLMKKFYENESINEEDIYRVGWGNIIRSILILLLIFIIGFVIIRLPFHNLDFDTKITIATFISFISFVFTIISGILYKVKISISKPHLFAPEQFEECFKEIVSNSLRKTKLKEKIARWINGDNAIIGLHKLVIVIDNIDRCSKDVAYNLLTDIKTFLSSEQYSIVFIIPVDDDSLRRQVLGENNNEKDEFLRKFFNTVIRIKPYGETDIFTFAKNINEKFILNLQNETLILATKEYSRNPRRVIQLFNNLLTEFSLYKTPGFVQKNETLICAVLILREEFNDYYKIILKSPSELIKWKPKE